MRIGLQTWGSDGDIRPFCALAGGLAKAGHEVTLGITSVDEKDYTPLADKLGFKVIHTGKVDSVDMISSSLKILKTWDPTTELRILFEEVFLPGVERIYTLSESLCHDNDIVIGHHIVYPLMAVADKLGKPHGAVMFCHGMIPTDYEPPAGMPNLGRLCNSLLWKLVMVVVDRTLKPMVNKLRKEHGIAPVRSVFGYGWLSDRLNLVAVGDTLAQRQPDWPDSTRVCGFLNMPESGEPYTMPTDLAEFIKAGAAPVYMTFGSMTQFAPEEQVRLMVESANMAGARAIIQADWSDLTQIETGDNIYKIGKTPHGEVFPRCAMVIHHGGSGTTQASLRAGVPSVVVAHGFDQPFWADVLRRIGVAGKVIHRRRATPEKLSKAIRRVYESEEMKTKAKAAGERMRADDGVGEAVKLIEEVFGDAEWG